MADSLFMKVLCTSRQPHENVSGPLREYVMIVGKKLSWRRELYGKSGTS
jgi:hypothetical protein